MARTTKRFESKISDLEAIVKTMEKGDLSLEEALSQFEKGVKLAKECQKALSEAEQKVRVLTEDESGELSESDL